MKNMVNFNSLLGKVVLEIVGDKQSDSLTFRCQDGSEYTMYHEQDCCESVYIEDIDGDLSRIVGLPITIAEELKNRKDGAIMIREEWFKSVLLAGMFMAALATNFGTQGRLETMTSSYRVQFDTETQSEAVKIKYFAMGMREAFGLLSEVK